MQKKKQHLNESLYRTEDVSKKEAKMDRVTQMIEERRKIKER